MTKMVSVWLTDHFCLIRKTTDIIYMDYRKINSHIILSLIVLIVGVTISMLGRRIMLEKGFDAGTANLTFVIILGVCVIGYLVILATLAHSIIPWVMKKLPMKAKPAPTVVEENSNVADEKEEIPELQSIDEIRQNAERQRMESQTAKINLFLEYSHLAMAPYITDDELLRLDEYIRSYAGEESLSKDIVPMKPTKLKNPDLFHFGWNMAHYFNFPKQDVTPWLQQVFVNLKEKEYSYIKGKLHDPQTKKHTIPNIDDIPKYLAEQNR
jgi:hypothetical protein